MHSQRLDDIDFLHLPATIRKLGRPPHLIMRIMDCVLLLFQRHVQPVKPDPIAPCPKPSWSDSLKVRLADVWKGNVSKWKVDI